MSEGNQDLSRKYSDGKINVVLNREIKIKLPLIHYINNNLSYKLMVSEILYVKLREVYYSAVWISTFLTSIKYLVTFQILCLTCTSSNFKLYVLRYM